MKTMMTRKISLVLGSVCLVAGAVFAAATPAQAGPPDCPADFDNSGAVDVKDLLFLLGAWGPCREGCIKDGTIDIPTCDSPRIKQLGDTTGAGNDSALRDSEDLIFRINIGEQGVYSFDLTANVDPCLWDSYMYLIDSTGDPCAGTDVIAFNDDCPGIGCSGLSCINNVILQPGEYWIVIEGFAPDDAGPVDLHVTSACLGITFFNNQAEFDAAIEAAGMLLKGFEEYPWTALPGFVIGVGDGLNINSFVAGWIKPGILLDNVTYQSNLDPFGANGINPRGDDGLALFTNGFIGATSNGLVANHFEDSFDILSGPPNDPFGIHSAIALQLVSFNMAPGGSSVTVTVYDKNDNLIGKAAGISAPANQGGAFLGIITEPGTTIGRVNIYDTTPGDFAAEGLYTLGVYVSGGK